MHLQLYMPVRRWEPAATAGPARWVYIARRASSVSWRQLPRGSTW